MRNTNRLLALLVACICLVGVFGSGHAFAAGSSSKPVTYSVSGRVRDGAQKPVAGATVTIGGSSARSASDGTYRISNITTGSKIVSVVKSGYFAASNNPKQITVTGNKTQDFTLTAIVLSSLQVSPNQLTVSAGKSLRVGSNVTVTAVFNDGSKTNITWSADVKWSVADTGIAKVPGDGALYGVKAGRTTASLSYGGKTAPVTIVVTAAFVPVAIDVGSTGGRISKDDVAKKYFLNLPETDKAEVVGYGGNTYKIHRLALQALQEMKSAAREAGFTDSSLLLPVSVFRTDEQQKQIWDENSPKYKFNDKEEEKYVARPGHSAHRTGRAVDLWLGYSADPNNNAKIRKTEIYGWLVKNASRFGFYPYDTEAWHWEYNPPANR